jgi:glutaredoxin-related protein
MVNHRQLTILGNHIGGCDAVEKLKSSGELEKLISTSKDDEL